MMYLLCQFSDSGLWIELKKWASALNPTSQTEWPRTTVSRFTSKDSKGISHEC